LGWFAAGLQKDGEQQQQWKDFFHLISSFREKWKAIYHGELGKGFRIELL
jgi:hypothetical protein